MLLTKSFKFELKSSDDATGKLTGYLSTFGNVDSDGDIVPKGAFVKALADVEAGLRTIPVLWQHDKKNPIGVFTVMKEDDIGLYVEADLDMEDVHGAKAYRMLKMKACGGLSMGFNLVDFERKGGFRYLSECDVREGSVVTFPANTDATASVKGDGGGLEFVGLALKTFSDPLMVKFDDFSTCLAEIQSRAELHRLLSDVFDAFRSTVSAFKWEDEQTDEERLATMTASVGQLSESVLSWAARYVATNASPYCYYDYSGKGPEHTKDRGRGPGAAEKGQVVTIEAMAADLATLRGMVEGLTPGAAASVADSEALQENGPDSEALEDGETAIALGDLLGDIREQLAGLHNPADAAAH